jgi:ATP-dependent Clp protease ATP-binding subunit ClpA
MLFRPTAVAVALLGLMVLTEMATAEIPHPFLGADAEMEGRAPSCQRCPLCDMGSVLLREKPPSCYNPSWRLWGHPAPAVDNVKYCLKYHLESVVGQGHVTAKVEADVMHKLRNPGVPLRMHFGGDNGVGKTHLAHHLSLATSLRFHPSCRSEPHTCKKGDNLHVIQAAGYLGIDTAEARKLIADGVCKHLAYFPYGIILLDDLTLMSSELVDFLAPLFGRGDHFAECPTVDLQKPIIIITSDFKGANHTRGFLTLEELVTEIKEQGKLAYSIAPVGALNTHPFWALDETTIRELVTLQVKRIPCREPSVISASIEPLALDWFVHSALKQENVERDNGRYVEERVHHLIMVKITDFLTHSASHDARFSLVCFINSKGQFALRFSVPNKEPTEIPVADEL